MSDQLLELRAMERLYSTSTTFPSWDGLESEEKIEITDAARNILSAKSLPDGSSRQKKKKQEKLQQNEQELTQLVHDWARRPRPSLPMDTGITITKDARKVLQNAHKLVVEALEDPDVRDKEGYSSELLDIVGTLWEELQPVRPEEAKIWEPKNPLPSRHGRRDSFGMLQAPSPAEAARLEIMTDNARVAEEAESRIPEVNIMAETADVDTNFETADAEAVARTTVSTAPTASLPWWGSRNRENLETLVRQIQNITTAEDNEEDDDKEDEDEEDEGDDDDKGDDEEDDEFVVGDGPDAIDPNADYVP